MKKYEEFNHNLIYKLRKHGLNKNLLVCGFQMIIFRSFKSLYFSLKENGINDFEIDVKKDTVKSIDIKAIKKVFNEIKIVENKNKFKISINKISEFKGKKNIIDQVKKREISKIDYIYGSLGTNKKQEKIKEYFKKIYQSNFNEFKKQKISEQIEFRSKKIVFNNQIYEIKYKKDKSFISIDSNTEDKSLVGAMILFINYFLEKIFWM